MNIIRDKTVIDCHNENVPEYGENRHKYVPKIPNRYHRTYSDFQLITIEIKTYQRAEYMKQ